MRLELEQNASSVPQLELRAAASFNQPARSHFDDVLANGISAAQSGNRAQARILLQYAIELDPKSEAGWLWLASISEYPEELLIFLDNVLEINAQNSRAIEWKNATKQLMAKTFVQRGIDAASEERNAEAMSCFDKALSYDEQSQLAWFWKDSMSKQNVSADAGCDSVQPVPSDPDDEPDLAHPAARDADTAFAEAENALAAGNSLEALALVNEAIDHDPESEKAWGMRSHLVDDFDEKRRSLERLVEINPENLTAGAALETLLAMVETVSPDPGPELVPAANTYSNAPFEAAAQPMEAGHENSPTQELELPEAIRQHNPFVSNESCELSGDVWTPELDVETKADVQSAPANIVSSGDYPTIEVPFDENPQVYLKPEDWENHDSDVEELENYATEGDPYLSGLASEASAVPEVQEVSAAAYLEESEQTFQETSYGDSFSDTPSWVHDTDAAIHETDGDEQAWVVDDSEGLVVDEPQPNGARTILVVDDSSVVRKLIAGKLEESGYHVISAGSGAEAIAVISNARPDLVLLDIAMPKMDGYQVCERIRKNESTRDVPVVMISGKDGYFDEDRGQKAGTSSFISKPFGPETLMKALDTYLPSPEAQ